MPEPAGLRGWLLRRWHGARPPLLLRPLSVLYGLVVRARRALYAAGWLASHHPGRPVIVVGNLTVGGTGKTPLVIWLAQQLRAAGQRPGVMLRGYGGKARAPHLVGAGDTHAEVGDEALLIARRTGVAVAVGADRVATARLLAAQGCTLLLADDGLQHLALRRDLAIAVVDGARGFGNGALLPAGPLREPASGLDAVDFVVLHGVDATGVTRGRDALQMSLQPGPLRALRGDREQPLQWLHGQPVHAVAGIGNPQRYFALLRELGARPVEHAFADHHPLSAADLAFGDALHIVMTEKDAVRCSAFAAERMWYLPVSASLPEAAAARLLRAVLATLPAGGDGRA